VTAAALSRVVKSGRRAHITVRPAGFRLWSASTASGGSMMEAGVYFVLPNAPNGSMRERTVVPSAQCLRCPDELDDVTAAAIANPGVSSWAAHTERAKLKIWRNRADPMARLAQRAASLVQIAKHLGAKKVIATGRDADALKSVAALGADVMIPLVEDKVTLENSFKDQFAAGVDVVVDYLWGQSAERLLIAAAKAGKHAVPIRFVQIGSISGSDITLPSAVLRSSAIELMGSGIGSIPLDRLVRAIAGLLRATVPGGFQIAAQSCCAVRSCAGMAARRQQTAYGVHYRSAFALISCHALPSMSANWCVTFSLTRVQIRYTTQRISLTWDAIMRALLTVERMRCPRADLQSASGRFRASSGRHYDRSGRCIPWTGTGGRG